METKPPRAEFGWPGGDRPGELVFRTPVEPEVHAVIVKTVAAVLPEFAENAELHALTPPDGAIGRYRLATARNACFVRVSARIGDAKLEQSVTAWLGGHGLPVSHLEFAGLSLAFGGHNLRLDIRELLDARHDDGSLEDLRKVATALATCHRLLREFPGAPEVLGHAAQRFTHLAAVRDTIATALERQDWGSFSEDADWGRNNREWLGEMVDGYQPRFDLMPDAQCLHAQVHRANVLFRHSDDAAVLLDFEEAVQAFAPIAWDLAYFVQRFCLADAPKPDVLCERLATVRGAYGAPAPGLANMMQQTAWFSMAILVDYQHRGIVSPRSEYDKFVRLEKQARGLAPILGEFFDV